MEYAEIKGKYPRFIYEKCEVNKTNEKYEFKYYFEIEGLKKFTPSLEIATQYVKNTEIDDAFLHEYIKKLARGKQSIYLILDSAEKADSLEGYLKELHPSVNVIGKYIWEEGSSTAEDLVNELNDISPDVIISKLPNATQLQLISENRRMINASVWVALLYERVITKKKKVSFGSKLDWMFYKRLFKRRVNKYEIEKAESEKLDGDLPEQEDVTEEATSEEPANENKTAE